MVHDYESQKKELVLPVSEEILTSVREAFALRFDDIVTTPSLERAGFPLDLPEKVRRGEKIRGELMIKDALVAVGQDFRLTPDQIDFLKQYFFNNKDTEIND